MHSDHTLIATVAVPLAFAFVGGLAASRLRLPPLVGYLLAGVAVGPFTPGFVADVRLAPQLAEIGVILLMFGVGLHFSVADLWAARAVAVPGAVFQIAAATAMGAALAHFGWGWPLAQALVFGLALSVASTVVLLRALEPRGLVASADGRVAVGWLVVEDLVVVVALVLLPALAPAEGAPADLFARVGLTLAKVAAFVALMLLVGARLFPWVLRRVERAGSRELFTLAAIALSLGVAYGASRLFGVSYALGAFFAGVVLNGSKLGHRAADELRPLQDAFGALFFVAVGMLFDPDILTARPLEVLAAVAIVVAGKSLAALLLVLALRRPLSQALIVAAGLAQIGEFSFILAELGVERGLLPREGQGLILAAALLSISLNPLVFALAARGRVSTAALEELPELPPLAPGVPGARGRG